MPTAVKITDLPVLSAVQPGDIVPIVPDPAVDGTQTSSATAAQIAALGGGPPGVNSVSTDKLVNGAVTAEKVGFTGPDKLISRIAAGPGAGVEIPCTAYARGLLSSANASLARAYLDALQSTNDPVFSGQVKVARGTASVPSLAPFDEPSTGIFFPEGGSVGFAYGQQEVFRLDEDGTILTRYAGESVLRPSYCAAAWVAFDGVLTSASTIRLASNQREIARRYGLNGTIGDNATTKSYMLSVEQSRGINTGLQVADMFPSSPTFNDSYGKGTNLPLYNRGTETRANYTTPGDNKHWVWSGSAWVQTNASGLFWIGTIDLTFPSTVNAVKNARNITSITRINVGEYQINFAFPMPDANYCVVGSAADTPCFVRFSTRTQTSVRAHVVRHDNTAIDSSLVSVAVFR